MTTALWVGLLLLAAAACFPLQGNWTLLTAPSLSSPAASPDPITLEITDYVSTNQSILQRLSFKGCNQLLLQSEFSQNQLFINSSSYSYAPIPGRTCSLTPNPLDSILQGLASVFYFQIFAEQLILNNPFGKPVYSFRRVASQASVDLSGVWNMNQYGNTRTSLSVQISSSQIVLCQGYSVYNYSLSQRNSIRLVAVRSSCPSQDLTQAVESVKYYRLNNGILDFYDGTEALIVEMVYSSPYDPTKPIFTTSVITTPTTPTTPTPSASNSSLFTSASTSSSPFSSTASVARDNSYPAAGVVSSGVSSSNIAGNWTIVSLFTVTFAKTNYYLLITPAALTLNGGCNTYTYQYTLTPATQLITLGNSSQTNNPCDQSDDQLYVSGISKMYKYLVSSSASAYSLLFYNQNGILGYSLYMKMSPTSALPGSPSSSAPSSSTVLPPSSSVVPPSFSGGQPATPNPFAAGQALMLVLQRRDLARAIVTITGNTLSYTLCNSITHTFTVNSTPNLNGNISISGGASSNNPGCANSNDQIYVSTLNSAVAYSYDPDAKTIGLSSSDGTQVITMNRV